MKPKSKNKYPKLFHIGTQKAASTFLYNLLANHSNVSLSKYTEINYFSSHYEKGEDWYLDGFMGDGEKIDTSPKNFMRGKYIASKMKEYEKKYFSEGQLRFLLVLRNPIDYLNSHFRMHLMDGNFKKNKQDYPEISKDLIKFIKMYPNYTNRAKYYNILTKYWLNHFSLEQFKIIFFEDLVKNKNKFVEEILRFFNLEQEHLVAKSVSKNKALKYPAVFKIQKLFLKNKKVRSFLKKSKLFNYVYDNCLTDSTRLDKEARNILKNIFMDDVKNLKNILNKNISCWEDFN